MVINGEVSYTGHIVAHARAAHAVSLMLDDVFPDGTDVGDTRARPEIWQNKAQFAAAVKALQTATGELVSVAESGDLTAVGAQLKKVGQACGGCHKPFRKKNRVARVGASKRREQPWPPSIRAEPCAYVA
jgi:cytochrome c556